MFIKRGEKNEKNKSNNFKWVVCYNNWNSNSIINSYSSYNVIKEINGSESVEKGVDKIINVPLSKEEQMEMFKNVSVDDVMEQFTNERSLMYATVNSINDSNFENKNVYDEINKNKEHFKNIVEGIISGEISIEEIKNNLENYKQHNKSNYDAIIKDIDSSVNVEHYNDNFENPNFKINNYSYTNQDKINDVVLVDDNGVEYTITSDQLALFTKIEKFLSRLEMYRDKTYGVAIASSVLTAASWAIAAFYWSAWWMFGTNIPFAVAATVQAGLSTWTSVEYFKEYYKAVDDVKNFKSIIDDSEFKDLKIVSSKLIEISKSKLSDSAISFSKFLLSFTNISRLVLKLVNIGLQKLFNIIVDSFNNIIKKFNSISFKMILKQMNSRVAKFASETIVKKTAMKAVSWASPASHVLTALDIVLNICSFGADIGIFNPSEIEKW